MSVPITSTDSSPNPDFRALFEALPGKFLVLDPDLTILAATDEYLDATMTRRHEIVGRNLFDVFPDTPDDPASDSGHNMRASVSRVLRLRIADAMPLARHDVQRADLEGGFEEKYWSPTNSPMLDGNGEVAYVIHRVEDVTEYVKLRQPATGGGHNLDVGDLNVDDERLAAELIENRVEVAALHTQLIEASTRMRQSEQTLREFLDFAPAVISARDTGGRLLFRNRHHGPQFRRPEDAEGRDDGTDRDTGPSLVTTELLDRSLSLERQVIETGIAVSAETEFGEAEGQTTIYEFIKFPLRTPEGDIYGVGTIGTDVTEDRRSRDELRLSEERFRQMAANMDEVFLLWEEGSLKMLYISPAVERIIGLSAAAFQDSVGGLSVAHPDDAEIVASPPAPLKEFRIIKPDGEVRWIRSRSTMIETAEGLPNRGVTTMTDFTDRKKAELAADLARTEAEEANRAKSEFLSRMSHELRTPLNAILGFGQLLEMDDLGEGQRDGVENIIRAGEHLLGLIDEVLDISRVETGRLRLSLEPVSLRDVTDEAIGMIQPIAARHGVRVEATSTDLDAYVHADRQRLKQVLVNLLANAVKYNRDGGEVRVAFAELGTGRLRLTVSDTGIGIAEADLERLFMPFERLAADQSSVQGTGLGLALTRHLMTAMAGQVDVSSRLGEGSTFWIELPSADAASSGFTERSLRAVDVPRATSSDRKTVLYVEDNVSNVRLLERVVERRPAVTLLTAMQGRLAVELALAHQPDLILLDLHLPDISGEDVLHAVRADPRTTKTPVVVLSADATLGGKARLLAQGATAYMTKPFAIPLLLEMIDTLGVGLPTATETVDTLAPLPTPTQPRSVVAAPAPGIREIAHDLNNLLGVITNLSTLIGEEITDARTTADLADISAAAQRATGLVSRLGQSHG